MKNSLMYRDITQNNKYLKILSEGCFVDYVAIHKKFIEYFKITTPKERLKIRHPEDGRLLGEYLYVENHHILPKSLGGSDDKDNLVLLLPEEHIFIHYLRYKTFNTRVDMLAFRFCVNGIAGKKNKNVEYSLNSSKMLNRFLRKSYADLKHNSAEFRINHGWQTDSGRKSISDSRIGTMPVKDVKTGDMVGSVSIEHPKVISGEWVHHSKGVKLSLDERAKKACHGEKNGKYSGITDKQIVDISIKYVDIFGELPTWKKLVEYCYCEETPMILHLSKFRFNDGILFGYKGYVKRIEKETGLKHSQYGKLRYVKITKELIKQYKENEIDKN